MTPSNHFQAYRMAAVFAGGCLLLSGVIWGEWMLHSQRSDEWAGQKMVGKQQLSGAVTMEALPINFEDQDVDSLLAAPLFIEGRQPIAFVDQAGGGQEQPLKLTGVLLAPQGLVALMQDDKKARFRLKEGDIVYGWRLSRVERNRVTLDKNNQSKQLTLSVEKHANVVPSESAFEQQFQPPGGVPPELIEPGQMPN